LPEGKAAENFAEKILKKIEPLFQMAQFF